MAGRLGGIGRRLAARHDGGRVGAGGQEQLDELDVAVLRRLVERRVVLALASVQIGARGDEKAADLVVSSRGGAVERLDAEVVPRVDVHLGAGLDQDPRRFGLAEEGREVEWREPVGREPVGQAGSSTSHDRSLSA